MEWRYSKGREAMKLVKRQRTAFLVFLYVSLWFEVVERTSHAVQLKGKGETWYNWSQCAAAEEPGRSVSETQGKLEEQNKEELNKNQL